ncbi:MAG TPA: M20/M25/M40 family metallo-hydrolase [Terriglobales bacterium]|nr:M20/M25/M40 family metallo-hydrolase [Terriglobales bacterium]
MRSVRRTHFAVYGSVILLAVLALPLGAQKKKAEAAAPAAAAAPETVDLQMVTRIRDEEFHHSQVMKTLEHLTDEIGQRLTGSPNVQKANQWTRDQFASWGLENAHVEKWGDFGRGWSEQFCSVMMIAPDTAQLYAIPEAWTPGTQGAVRAPVVAVKLQRVADFEKYRGKLAGKIVLLGEMPALKLPTEPDFKRYDDQDLDKIYQYQIPGERPPFPREEIIARVRFQGELNKFLAEEKVVAAIEPSRGDGGLIFVQSGASYKTGEPVGVPKLEMAVEHFGRIARLLERDVPVELEVNVQAKFDEDQAGYDTLAEIPGTDKKDEIVMLGAHLDSWHGGTGATDNGAGSAVVMEAVRILKALGVKPRRTIRVALWTGEEEGLLGSRGYVANHFGSRPAPSDPKERDLPSFLWREQGSLTIKPEQAQIAAYFNIDNGTGKLRGIYTQENAAVVPIFEEWLKPFHDLGATTVTNRNTGGTDHLSFDAVGIPGFQFIQDPMDYFSRTHHSNMDVYERAQREDLMQASAILASFVYNAAMRDQMLPRKPLPPDTKMEAPPAPATPAKPGKKK